MVKTYAQGARPRNSSIQMATAKNALQTATTASTHSDAQFAQPISLNKYSKAHTYRQRTTDVSRMPKRIASSWEPTHASFANTASSKTP